MKSVVGIVGLGLLGGAIAQRLLRGGAFVVGYDLREEANRELEAMGGCPAPLAVAARAPRVLLSLPDSDVVERVVSEVEPALAPGQVILDTTTGHPERIAALAERLLRRGVDYADVTVLGSSDQARQGEVIVLAGGPAEVVGSCEGVLRAFARRVFHVGPCGSGARMKLVVNLVLGLNRAVLAEGLSFAWSCGLDVRAALEILRDGSAYSRVMDVKGEKMLAGDFAPQARLSQHLKDVRLILEQASRVGAMVPLSEVHAELLRRVVEMGGGDDDNSAVIRAYSPPVDT